MVPSRVTRRAVLGAGAAGMAGLAGCSSVFSSDNPFEGGGGEGRALELGVVIPQSGDLGEFGGELEDGIRLVEHQLEAVNDPDWSLDIEIRDSESDPDAAVEAFQGLVDDGYEAIVGPGSAESAEAVTEEVLLPEGVVACSPLASAGLLDMESDGLFLSIAPRSRVIGRAMARPIQMNGVTSAAILHSTSRYGESLNESIENEIGVRGIDITAQVPVEPDDDYGSKLEESLADDPDGLIVVCNPGEGVPLLDTYYSEYDPVTVVVPDRLRINDLPERVGSDLVGASVVSLRPEWHARGAYAVDDEETDSADDEEDSVDVDEGADRLDRFADAFENRHDRVPSIHAAQAFDATLTLFLPAVSAGEDSTGEEIAARVEDVINYRENYMGASVDLHYHHNYWEGLARISEGIQNSYTGATGPMNFSGGIRQSPDLHAAVFDPEADYKFEESLPIPT